MFSRSMTSKNSINEVIDEKESIQTNTDYRKDSFEDRFCDDLSQVLLAFLPFEDKFRFESISKQWKSLVFNEQKCFTQRNFRSIFTNRKLNRKAFEDILKKCKRIDSINILWIAIDYRDRDFMLCLITKHCNHLKSISFDFTDIDIKTIESFSQKFSQSLKSLEIWGFNERNENNSKKEIKPLIKNCNKLVSIKRIHLIDLFDENGESVLMTERLESFDITIDSHAIKQFENLIHKYKDTVRVVSINFGFVDFIDQYLREISKLINLKELKLTFHVYISNITDITECLGLISRNCSHLEKFSFSGFDSDVIPFKPFTQLKQLKCLSINPRLFRDEIGGHLSVKSFENFKCLTHLSVTYVMNSDFFLNIDQYLPQLKSLICFHNGSYDLDFSHLSKLPVMEKLFITYFYKFTPKAFENVIIGCKTIKSVKVDLRRFRRISINKTTIDGLISLAVKKPETIFRFMSYISQYIDSYWDQLPNKPNNLFFDNIKTYP